VTEPDVTVTDYLLALEGSVFAMLLWRLDAPASEVRAPFVLFFAATAAAALAGGTVHGFLLDGRPRARLVLWRVTLAALGVAAYATWAIAATLLLQADAARTVRMAAAAVALGYGIVVVAVSDRFWVAIAHYLPAAFALLAAFTAGWRDGHPSMQMGVAGMVLTFAAALVQLRRIALHPTYFNHNALYHALQAVALFFIFSCARGLS
jgi:hypothetical protein